MFDRSQRVHICLVGKIALERELYFRCGHGPRIVAENMELMIWRHGCVSWVEARGAHTGGDLSIRTYEQVIS